MENKVTKRLFLGGLLMTATEVLFGMSQEAGALAKKLIEDFKEIVRQMKINLGRFRAVNQEDFDKLLASLVDEYDKKKEISSDSKKKVVDLLKSKWIQIKKEYGNEVY